MHPVAILVVYMLVLSRLHVQLSIQRISACAPLGSRIAAPTIIVVSASRRGSPITSAVKSRSNCYAGKQRQPRIHSVSINPNSTAQYVSQLN
ncbi:hypothetical protein K491DRAFT_690510 [Lophiostoma macrostomum CBS 122681]|uniref:Secreted protein n=1 Tax=Lophiostoma macrostomum CBS 122681 TaxID=1314788 RepID=A0A6A6TD92_9PLEO|nr:hypothetical protein K491DRAFT_690510 [Lophiostoma macrostomum CBS 122681]